jgi:hypothetical protein
VADFLKAWQSGDFATAGLYTDEPDVARKDLTEYEARLGYTSMFFGEPLDQDQPVPEFPDDSTEVTIDISFHLPGRAKPWKHTTYLLLVAYKIHWEEKTGLLSYPPGA